MKRILLLIIAATLSFSCVKQQEGKKASGGSSKIDTSSLPVRWSGGALASSLNLKISTDFTNSFAPADLDGNGHNPIEQMMKQWNNTTGVYDFFKVNANTTSNKQYSDLSSYNDGEMGIYKHTGWFSNVSSSALAITQFFGVRRAVGSPAEYVELTHADIIVNYRDYDFSLNAASTTAYDLPTVVLHELGHFIGIAHVNDWSSNSIMLPYLGIFDSQRTLNTYDQNLVRSNYQLSSLIASRNLALKASASSLGTTHKNEGEIVRGVIELRNNGKCHHYINGKLVHTH